MGGGESRHGASHPADLGELDQPSQYTRMRDDTARSQPPPSDFGMPHSNLVNMAFVGIWSVITPTHICPPARAGQFTVVDETRQLAFVGYGTSHNGAPLQDLWALDLVSLEWTQVPLRGTLMTPRNGVRAVFLTGKDVFLFGGFFKNCYLADSWTIDVDSGVCQLCQTGGEIPDARSTPIMALSDQGNVVMWGGYNGNWPDKIHVLDVSSMTWTSVPAREKGRTGIPSVKVDNSILAFGGSHSDGVLVLDMDSNAIRIVQTTGFGPQHDVMSSGMVKVGNYVFYFGGKAQNSDWTILYALDIQKMWWFVFHVRPDGETVNLSDGLVSDNGIFMLPRIHTFGVAYSKVHRAIVAFLGIPYQDPPHLFIMRIGEAMGYINLREDMRNMLSLSE